MSSNNISVHMKEGILSVETNYPDEQVQVWTKPVSEFVFKNTEDTEIKVAKEDRYQVLLWHPMEDDVLLVYVKGTTIKCVYTTQNLAHLRLIDRANRVLSVTLNKKYLKIVWFGGIRNTFNASITDCRLTIDERVSQDFNIPVSNTLIHSSDIKDKKYITTFIFKTSNLVRENAKINCTPKIHVTINGHVAVFPLSMRETEIHDSRNYYIPLRSIYYHGFAMHLRRSLHGNLVLVRRAMEPIEHTSVFRFFESRLISALMFHLGKLSSRLTKNKKCLFYEKFAEKAEEGVFDLFCLTSKDHVTNSYFIIDKNSPDFAKIKGTKNVVAKYSPRYYWLLFTSTYFISTETPGHINVLRTNNNYLRKTLIQDKKFIFLQHGITYLKCHDLNSPFCAGKEAEPTYMMVSSEKELEVCSLMLGLDRSRFLKTGLPIYSKISYKHLNQNSADIAVIMLTWKPYEEYLTNFEESSYYKNVCDIFSIVNKWLPAKNILIVPHPKIRKLMEGTHLSSSLWNKPISEALNVGKLLITDYSSVCYNSFYQGAGVVFYQEDIDYYEEQNGKLIPADNEYIGKRVFSPEELESFLQDCFEDGRIILDKLRNPEFEKRYKSINEFSDGQNIQRIYSALKQLDIL